MIFAATGSVLDGTMPYYRMQIRIRGSAGTFVPGGNAKVNMLVHVPSPIINRGVRTMFDVAIP